MDTERDFKDLSSTLQFAFVQMMKNINTCLPGIVESFDPARRRVRVKPALNLLTTDGEILEQATIANVPLVTPAFGNILITGTVKPNDAVLLLFSQRGLGNFKQFLQTANPDKEAFFSRHDAIALPGFGPLVTVPATTNGISIQTADGTTSIVLEQGNIRIVTPGTLTITAPTVNMASVVNIVGSLTVNGTPIG